MSKVVLVTGTSTGFGRDTAETLARANHSVYASMRDPNGKNRAHADALRGAGLHVVELDVGSDASVQKAVDTVLNEAGRLDVLVNNAGIASVGVTEAFTAEQAQGVFDTNVIGLLRVTRAVLPGMRANRDALVVNIGSILGRVTFPFFGIYGASKMAVEALTDSLRYEVSELGVEVVLVQPSAYPTNMYASVQIPTDTGRTQGYGEIGKIPDAMFQTFTSMFTGENAPQPHDVAEAVAKVIATARGERPPRTVVGTAFGSDTINRDTAPVQQQVVDGLGLGHLAKIAA